MLKPGQKACSGRCRAALWRSAGAALRSRGARAAGGGATALWRFVKLSVRSGGERRPGRAGCTLCSGLRQSTTSWRRSPGSRHQCAGSRAERRNWGREAGVR